MLHPNKIFLYLEKYIIKKSKIFFWYLIFIFDTKVQLADLITFKRCSTFSSVFRGRLGSVFLDLSFRFGILALKAYLTFYVLLAVLLTFGLDSLICRVWSRNLASRCMEVVRLELIFSISLSCWFFSSRKCRFSLQGTSTGLGSW